MICTPYFRAALLASSMVELSEVASIATISAPAFAAISTSMAPVSTVFISATIFGYQEGISSFAHCVHPSLLMRGVPASIQSAPPATASLAI